MQAIGAGAGLVVATVLLFAGLSKALSLAVFAEQIADYRIVPYPLASPLARAIVSLELSAPVLIIGGLAASSTLRQIGAALAAGMLATFCGALAYTWGTGREVACGCFGGGSEIEVVGLPSIVRTGLLAALSGLAVAAGSMSSPFAVAGLAVLLGLLLALCSELSRLLGPMRHATWQLASATVNEVPHTHNPRSSA